MEMQSREIQLQQPVLGDLKPKILLNDVSKPYSDHCQIEAENDLEAVQSWLQQHRGNQHTYNAYYKESRRLLLWCVHEKGLSLGQLKVQDFEQYFEFLKDPPIHWCKTIFDKKGRQSPWRPLRGSLSEPACRMAFRVLNSLMNYLVQADYLRANPLKLLNSSVTQNLDLELQKYKVWERMLEPDEWEAVQKALQEMPAVSLDQIDNKMRTQFLFALLYLLGLRIHEVALSNWNAFRNRDGHWWFFIKGKGGKPGHVPVNDQLLSYVKSYRIHLGMAPLPDLDEMTPLLVSKRTGQPLKVRQLYGLIKAIGKVAAEAFNKQSIKRKKLEQLSPHWLRHLSASHQDKAGIPATVIQVNHRHRSSQTTQIYLHAEDLLRSNEIQKLRMTIEPQVIVQDLTTSKIELKITLKGSALCGRLNLSRMLESIEKHVFKNIPWQRKEIDTEALLNRYEQLKKFGEGLEFSYYLSSLQGQELNNIKQAIQREGSIRLFDCKFEDKSVS